MNDTRTELISQAEFLVRRRGYSGFSYADLAEVVGIRKASIHHHFPTKSDLAFALVAAYDARYEEALDAILAAGDDGAARIEELALQGICQCRFAAAREAGEKDSDGLLAEAGLPLFLADVAPLAVERGGGRLVVPVVVAAAFGRAVENHPRADGAVGQAVDDDQRPGRAVAAIGVEQERLAGGDRAAAVARTAR